MRSNKSGTKVEPVLLVPPCLTQSAYALLVKHELVPRKWHLEGRYGSRTFRPSATADCSNNDEQQQQADADDRRMGLPLLPCAATRIETNSRRDLDDEIQSLLATPDVELIYRTVPHPKSAPKMEHVDATVHPELAPPVPPTLRRLDKSSSTSTDVHFTFMELFSGIGGFGLALEALGGQCLFASEINEECNKIYLDNLTHPPPKGGVHGDIYKVPDSAFPKEGKCNLLVAGFPCQPFSRLGKQPGLGDGDRGLLYTQIVRALRVSRPNAFILENVPGLVELGDSLKEIVKSLEEVGYHVTVEVVSARGLTAQSRKRLFFVGFRRGDDDDNEQEGISNSFQFPFVPDLGLRARDIIEYDQGNTEKSSSNFDSYRLSAAQMDQLLNRSKRWKPAKLAWSDNVLDTLDGHYGITIGKGNSQLVPCAAPANPRLFTPRECARVMGFPNSFRIPELDAKAAKEIGGDANGDGDDGVAERSHRKRLYLMFGNAVCPPLSAALGGAVLAECKRRVVGKGTKQQQQGEEEEELGWRRRGLEMAISLSLESIPEERRKEVLNRLMQSKVVVK